MPAVSGAERALGLSTPLGDDALVLTAFSGQEFMSRLFTYRLDMISPKESIAPKDLLGKNVTFSATLGEKGKPRYFNGFLSQLTAGSGETGMRSFTATIVPWLWFLTRKANCRVFQDISVPDILEKLFKEAGFIDWYSPDFHEKHEPRNYCVQYRETDFNFVSRLMEEEGIFYFFKHENGKHKLVASDSTTTYKPCEEYEVEHEQTYGQGGSVGRILAWGHDYFYTSGQRTITEYNFESHPPRAEKTPAKMLLANEETVVDLENIKKGELFDYPGKYEKPEQGGVIAKQLMQSDEQGFDTVTGASLCKSFALGGTFKIKKHPAADEVGKQYVITTVSHHAQEASFGGGGYSNTFTCMPDNVVYRPARTTPKPAIMGTQTAVVTGPPGEEIHPDKHGRVKVQFFWDREGVRNDKSSCWVRCAQPHSGKNWGVMFIPRIGMEVVVAFQEGDPDRPIILGSVYNADSTPPYTLPEHKTRSTIKTNSSPTGKGFNEIRFEDKKHQEQIFIHAQKDLDLRVSNQMRESVVNHKHVTIGTKVDGTPVGDLREWVFGDHHEQVVGLHSRVIGANYSLQVGGSTHISKEEQGDWHIGLIGDLYSMIKRNSNETIEKDARYMVGGKYSVSATEMHCKMKDKMVLSGGGEIHLVAQSIVIDADEICLMSGSNFVNITKAGVAINGTSVLINSGGSTAPGSPIKCDAPQFPGLDAATKPSQADNDKSGQKLTTPYDKK